MICPAGKYSNASATSCADCTVGYLCPEGSTSAKPMAGICPMGSYCDDMITSKQCPAGTYGNRTGATSQADGCATCPAGYYCIQGTSGYPSKALRCPPGHYCLAGTSTPYQSPCPDGTFSRTVGNERREQCESCPVGYYCQGGDRTGDNLCPMGHFCPVNTSSATQHPCPAGYYTEVRGSKSKSIPLCVSRCSPEFDFKACHLPFVAQPTHFRRFNLNSQSPDRTWIHVNQDLAFPCWALPIKQVKGTILLLECLK